MDAPLHYLPAGLTDNVDSPAGEIGATKYDRETYVIGYGLRQGVAVTDPVVAAVSGAANGDPTPLQFANVVAELYGFDIVARYRISGNWRLDATLNYVRGKRTDVRDNLFRIAPLNGRLALTADLGNWSLASTR